MADNRSFESTLHDIVYSIDTGTGLKIIRVTLYILVLLVIAMLYTATQFRGFKSEEAMDLAQLGRNFSVQNGMVTKNINPLTMWKVQTRTPNEDPLLGAHPDMSHPPAYPALLSAGFKLFDLIGVDPFKMDEASRNVAMPAEQWIILPLNHLFVMLTGWLIFSMGKRLFSREIGLIGMTIYYLTNLVWKDSISGLNITMAGFFVTAAYHAMIVSMLNKRDNEAKAKWIIPFFLSILYTAIAVLTRYISIVIVPGLCLFAWLMSGRFRGGTRFAVIFLVLFSLMVAPWLARNYKVTGNPFGMIGYSMLADTAAYPDNALSREYHPEIKMGAAARLIKAKWVSNYSGEYAAVIPSMGGGVLMAIFIVAFFYHFVRPQVNYLRWGVGIPLLLMVLLAGLFSGSSIQMLHVFYPFVILYALAFFYILIDRLDLGVRLYNIGLKVFIVILAALPFLLTILPPHAVRPYPPYHAPLIKRVSEMLNAREVLVTDMPWATAWYGDRVSILLPKDTEQFYEINDYKQYISGIYLTTITKDKPFVRQLLDGPEKSWFPIVTGQIPKDFPLKEGIALNRMDQLFLSDRNRWSAGQAEAAAPQ